MAWMPNGAEVQRAFSKLERLNRQDPKQGLVIRSSSEKFGYYLVDGERVFKVSSKARRKGGIGDGRLISLLNYLKLGREEFKQLCECPMSGPDYHALIKDKIQKCQTQDKQMSI